ncbi:MAG: diguanylate cyclase [Pseudobutyrivibrio sp.]|nr:diguanylate cyclase [Pseudobutyrivibrio sp.]
MAKKILKNSLKSQMLKMTLIPLILMTVLIVATSVSIVRASITDQIEKELTNDAKLIGFVFDEFYVGEYSVINGETEDEIEIYKGEQKLNGENTLIGEMSKMLNIDVSIFIDDTRILTTLVDQDGNIAMGTKAATIVKNDVLENGESAFYDNVMVYNQQSFAYYEPIYGDDGSIIGMIAVCRSGEDVQKEAIQYIIPIIAICILVAIFFGVIMVSFNKRLGDRIYKMDRYMEALANGEFDNDIPRELLKEDDEIKHLANDGRRMARSIKTLVEYDALTGLNNRRSADKKLEDIRIKAVETGLKYCLCIGDIDFFKKVNDTYGHEMGDIVLKAVSEKLKTGMRGKGFAARWGGEEFLLIFENRELDIAKRELEMILEDVRTIYVPDTDRQITMSFGLTNMDPTQSIDENLNRADDNLYTAKEAVRNKVVCE